MSARFVTFEGPEGCGKSTQIRRLAERLRAEGIECVRTREPGGTSLGEAVRGLLQHDLAGEPPVPAAELLLFVAARAQLVETVVRPALKRGLWVLCDRFYDSTLAYQGYGRGMELAALRRVNAVAVGDCRPDRTFLLDLPVERGFERLATRYAGTEEKKDRFERETLAFHRRVRAGYLELAAAEPERFRVLDADRSPEAIAEEILFDLMPEARS